MRVCLFHDRSRTGARRSVQGFTLFEISISLLIIAFGVVSVMLFMPKGLQAQQQARFKVYASAKAMEMIEVYNSAHNANPAFEAEAPQPWDVHVTSRNTAPDLEARLSSFRFGVFPLPLEIARRVDSDGGTMARILDEGGYLYYSQPLATTGLNEAASGSAMPPNEAQKLVIGVVGYAQNNALYAFPWKAWPYYTAYPSPPAHGNHRDTSTGSAGHPDRLPVGDDLRAVDQNGYAYLWENSNDADVASVFLRKEDDEPGSPSYGYWHHETAHNKASAVAYLQVALWYCGKKITDGSFSGSDFYAGTSGPPAATAPFYNGAVSRYWQQVLAMRFLSHAATCLTGYHTHAELLLGVEIPSVRIHDVDTPELLLTHDLIVSYHDQCLRMAMQFAASYPYDWGAPRPLQRATMMDHPLIEFDLGSEPLSGTIFGSGGVAARQWRPVTPRPITNLGRSFTYPSLPIPAGTFDPLHPATTIFGNPDHSTLTAPFTPAERCRQLVFWIVDWQSYADFETAPSAPVDAGRYMKGAPIANRNLAWLMDNPGMLDWQLFGYMNPEKVIAFTQDSAVKATGTAVPTTGNSDGHSSFSGPSGAPGRAMQGTSATAKKIFSGRWGADRNCNAKLDRGPLPPSVRLRAIEVARFHFYDLRVPALIR